MCCTDTPASNKSGRSCAKCKCSTRFHRACDSYCMCKGGSRCDNPYNVEMREEPERMKAVAVPIPAPARRKPGVVPAPIAVPPRVRGGGRGRVSPAPASPASPVPASPVALPVEDIDDLIGELDAYVGLKSLKATIGEFIAIRKHDQNVMATGGVAEVSQYHFQFIGQPGTGKTEVARLMGRILRSLGLLSKGHTVETTGAGLTGEYVGQTKIKVAKLFKEASGGVLFIDEAYGVMDGGGGYGSEAINALLTPMSGQKDITLIVAGYPDRMESFIRQNDGLPRRFQRKCVFESFKAEELIQIFCLMVVARKEGCLLTREAKVEAEKLIQAWFVRRDKSKFGNAGDVKKLVDKTFNNYKMRCPIPTKRLEAVDIPKLDDFDRLGIALVDQIHIPINRLPPRIQDDYQQQRQAKQPEASIWQRFLAFFRCGRKEEKKKEERDIIRLVAKKKKNSEEESRERSKSRARSRLDQHEPALPL